MINTVIDKKATISADDLEELRVYSIPLCSIFWD